MIVEININGEILYTTLIAIAKQTEKEYEHQWELHSEEYDDVKIKFTEGAGILKEDSLFISNNIQTTRKEIEAIIDELLKKDLENRQEGLDDSLDNEGEIERQPYDYKYISIKSERWSISFVHDLITKYGDLELNPDFQRNFVWDYKRKSRLIESLMLKIPIPTFYLSETNYGKYQVVDGLQRLTTITEFMDNKFALKYLEYLKNEDEERNQEGKWFKDNGKKRGISPEFHRNILTTQITVNIIEAKSPIKVKYDVFRRVNTGGKPLNNQEIRNCLVDTKTRNLLNELASSEEFIMATGGSVKTTRMQAQELVLRFIGFWHERILEEEDWAYKGSMTEFLDNAIELLNESKGKHYEKIRKAFSRSMKNAYYLFGEYAFRKCVLEDLAPDARKRFINKSLFTTWSVVLSQYDTSYFRSKTEFKAFAKKLAERLEKDRDYFDKVSYKTNDKESLKVAFKVTEELVKTIKSDNHE